MKVVEYNPYGKQKVKHSRKTASKKAPAKKAAHKTKRRTISNPLHNPSKGIVSGIVPTLKTGAIATGGFAGAWASNKYLWALLPSTISGSESLTKVRGALPVAAGIFAASRKSKLAQTLGLGLVAGGLYDIIASMTSGVVPTLGAERVVYRPVPVRSVGFEAAKPNPAPVGFEASRNSSRTVGFEAAKRTPFVAGSLARRSALTGVESI